MPYLHKLCKILLLEDYHPLTLKYGTDNPKAHAECGMAYPYKTITISYGDGLVKDWKNKRYTEVLHVLTHEMCHPITDPFYAKACDQWRSKVETEDERERLTDHIANIILKAGLM